MKKFVKGLICAGVACTMLTAVGCKTNNLDTETRQLQLATAALDGNFNPFFYTSLNDGNIIGNTQLALITTDEKGNLVCGDNEATVALDWSKIKYADKEGNQALPGTATLEQTDHTTYEFLIKKGIKYSNGAELTIKDVLFNLYVYLDPAYTGSATMYSVDIKGLNKYRMQMDVGDGDLMNTDTQFTPQAQQRIMNLINWSAMRTENYSEADLTKVKNRFKEEIESDWTSVEASWRDSYKNSYRFTETWEAYLFSENVVTVQTQLNSNGSTTQRFEDKNGDGKKQDGELYYTTLDPDTNGTVVAQSVRNEIESHVNENLSTYKSEHNCDDATAKSALQREAAINIVYRNYAEDRRQIQSILTVWVTASTILEDFVGEARTKYYEDIKNSNEGALAFPTIEGITTHKATTFNGKALGSEYDVLQVVVNGIDPKAEYNFGFSVAPLSYYSGEYNGKNYATEADGVTKFGVDMGNKDFYDKVVQATEKNGLPVGAGPYKATTSRGGEANRSSFFENNIVYFQRNDNFTTVGSGINNAKIKYLNYKVLSDDKIMDALATKSIDLGTPNATPTNSGEVAQNSFLASTDYRTGGYGYIGINPKYVPEIYVRQALMKAMDTSQTLAFYGSRYSERIYRPVSTTSWSYTLGYPGGASVYESDTFSAKYDNTDDKREIKALMERAGYVIENGIYTKRRTISGISNAPMGTTMKLTFTLAGETTEHPAYSMFNSTRDILNEMGFDITVTNDIQALKKLNSGNLAIWAAAWSSASDPDMYQVYHKDSNTTSVNNKNYKNILNDTSTWAYEYNIIDRLSGLIVKAREMDDQGTRAGIYAQCYDLVMELAVELPTYQRSDLCVYNKEVISAASLVQNPSYIVGLFDRIWEIDYVK